MRLDYKTEDLLVLKNILKAVAGKGRIEFSDSQRQRLSTKAKELTPKKRGVLRACAPQDDSRVVPKDLR